MSANLIDTYVSEVGRHLPGKNRTDIQAEIHSILQDMLDERSQKTGKPVDEEMTIDVLKDYGSPEKVAATYQGERYLIGPRLYPIFLMVVRIVFPVIAVLAGISVIFNVSHHVASVSDTFRTIIYALIGLATSTISGLGYIVLIFVTLEWILYRAGTKVDLKGLPKEKEWDPRSLAKVSTPNQLRMAETILEIVGCFAAIVIFNFYPQIIGIGTTTGEGWFIGLGTGTFTPLLSQAFFYYVPYMTLVWILTIILNVVLLRMARWTTITRIFSIGLKVINILIAGAMLAGPSLIAVTASTLADLIGDTQAASVLMTILTQGVRVLLWVTIIGGSIDVIRGIYRAVIGAK